MLEIQSIDAGYHKIQVLWDVSLEVKPGEIVALVGSNGAGKTTTLNAVNNLVDIYSGRVMFDANRLDRCPPYDILTLGLTHVPESRNLFGGMTVRENLEMGSYRIKDPAQREQSLQRVFKLFPRLAERRKQMAGTLSGGEQQMLALGRGLMSRPRLLMLDEPSLGLAPVVVEELFAVIQQVNAEGIAILLVEQNLRQALSISNQGYVLENGRIVLSGPAGDLLQNEEIKSSYLGLKPQAMEAGS